MSYFSAMFKTEIKTGNETKEMTHLIEYDIQSKNTIKRTAPVSRFATMPRSESAPRSEQSSSRRSSNVDPRPKQSHRSRSTDDRMKGPDPQSARRDIKTSRRNSSTGDLGAIRPALKVKTQYESLKRNGIRRSRANARNKVEFSFLEVREYPMIL